MADAKKIWLIKSEPDVYSYDDLVKDKKTNWTGVRNYAARIHLRAMQVGDTLLYYHSNVDKSVVGLAKVVKAAYPDPTATDGDWVCVDIAPVKKLNKPVNLEQVKAEPKLKEMILLKISRLSVQPVKPAELDLILKMAETKG